MNRIHYIRLLRQITLGILVCSAISIGAAYLAVRLDESRAERLVNILASVTPGTTSEEETRKTLEHGSFQVGSANNCALYGMPNCDQFAFSNKWLSYSHMTPHKYVWVTLDYRDGILISKSVQFAEDPRISAVSRQLLRRDETSNSSTLDRQVTVNINSPDNAIIKIYDNENVAGEQRSRDWKINLSCLSKFPACRDPRLILSGAFTR